MIDRRLFTSEGELRPEALDEDLRQPPTDTAPPTPSTPAATPPAPDAPVPPAETPRPSRSFQLLIDFVARNAAALLGGFPDPRTGQVILDLEGAQELIDMLDALREKTRGNLASDEDRFLLEVIGSLKIQFLEMSKAAAKAMRENASKARPERS